MDVQKMRRERIAATLAQVRASNSGRITQEFLGRVKDALIGLANERGLFPLAGFPAPATGYSTLYRLAEDPDGTLALYLQTALAGNETPPHDHGTWAVIAGVVGEEENILYERLDSGDQPGRGTIERRDCYVVKPGTALALMPRDVHSIHLNGAGPAIHLHLYGKPLERMTDRVWFDPANGTTAPFETHPDIVSAQ